MNELRVFDHKELGGIRVLEKDGQAWFVGKDVASILGYSNSRKAMADHVDGEDKNTVTIRDGIQGNPNMTIINESGLYALILSSKLPTAKKFKRWVTSEVLPSIRKTGGYINGGEIEYIIRAVTAAVMEQISAIVKETVKQTLNSLSGAGGSGGNELPSGIGEISRAEEPFGLLDIKDPPSVIMTDANLEGTEFWESLLLEWRRFRTFIKYKKEADKAFIALCNDKYPDLPITLRSLYRKWKIYEETGRSGLIDRRGKHGNHRRKVVVTVEIDGGPDVTTEADL